MIHGIRNPKGPLLRLTAIFLLALAASACTLQPYSGDSYYEEIIARTGHLTVLYPHLAAVETLTDETRYPILLLSLSSPGSLLQDKPRILITGAIHGNEPVSAEITIRLAEHLAGQYGLDQEITALLDACVIDFLPVINTFGLVSNTRENEAGVDLNRDFGYPDPELPEDRRNPLWFHPWDEESGFASPESRALRALCEQRSYLFSIQGHTGAENINVPMDYLQLIDRPSSSLSEAEYIEEYMPIYPLMIQYAQDYAESLQRMGMESFYATEGADWYPAYGTFADWHFGALGSPAFTIEYTSSKGTLNGAGELWDQHREALTDLLAIAGRRRQGTVTDSAGDPVSAVITAVRIQEENSRELLDPTPIALMTRSSATTGFFSLLVPDGSWELNAEGEEASGYTITVDFLP